MAQQVYYNYDNFFSHNHFNLLYFSNLSEYYTQFKNNFRKAKAPTYAGIVYIFLF